MNKRAIMAVCGAAATAALVTSATAATAAGDDEAVYADIYVSLDLPGLGDGPMEFEANGVLVGDGPELTADDLISNPSDWCGDIMVDVDLEAATLDVTGGEEPCNFTEAYLALSLSGAVELEDAELEFDELFEEHQSLLGYGVESAVFDAYWVACNGGGEGPVDETVAPLAEDLPAPAPSGSPTSSPSPTGSPSPSPSPSEEPDVDLLCGEGDFGWDMSGETLFDLVFVSEEPTPTPTPSPETDVDDADGEAAPATPVVAAPSFTG